MLPLPDIRIFIHYYKKVTEALHSAAYATWNSEPGSSYKPDFPGIDYTVKTFTLGFSRRHNEMHKSLKC